MRHFKLPLIATGVAFALGLIVAVIAITAIFNSDLSSRRMNERASQLGSGLGIAISIVVAPFWLVAAAKVGKERRARRTAK